MNATLGRRELLRLSATGAVTLAAGSSLAGLITGCSSSAPSAEGYRYLRAADLELLRPLIPVALEGALPAGTKPEAPLQVLDDLLHHISPGGRKPLFQLLDLLQLAPARWYLTGTWTAFADQSEEQLRTTLTQWGESSSGFARLARYGIIQPLMMAWYAEPEIARTTGYPGPPEKVS